MYSESYMSISAHVEVKVYLECLLGRSLSYLLRAESLTEPGTHQLVRAAGQQVLGTCLFPLLNTRMAGVPLSLFSHGAEHLNSGPLLIQQTLKQVGHLPSPRNGF